MGLASGLPTANTDLAAIVRFNLTGTIDARNDGAYQAVTSIPYSGGATYHFRMVVNVLSHTYSAYVTPPGGTEQTIGVNYAFRTEQNTVTSLSALGTWVSSVPAGSSNTVCGLNLTNTGYQVNSGGPTVAPWAADTFFTGGLSASTTSTIDTSAPGAAPMALYQTERWGGDANQNPAPFSYTFPNLTPNASYTVRLHFAEVYWTRAGQRKFNVAINGTPVLTNFDIFATAGARNKAVVESFAAPADANGRIVVSYTVGSADAPKSSGIEIVR
jgi:hypothetical protein